MRGRTVIFPVLRESPSPLLHPSTTPLRKNRPNVRRFLSLPSKCVRLVQRVPSRARSRPPGGIKSRIATLRPKDLRPSQPHRR